MYSEIEGILHGNLPSKWSQDELTEIWHIIFSGSKRKKFCVGNISYICNVLRDNANLIRHPSPEDTCPGMWISVLLFTDFKNMPLYINHSHEPVKETSQWRLRIGK